MKYFILLVGVLGLSACVCTDSRDAPEIIAKASPIDCDHSQSIPEMAIKEQVKGWVLLAYSLDKNGFPVDMEVIDSNPQGYFEETALATYSACQFVKTAHIETNERLMMNLEFNYTNLKPYSSVYAQQ
ncbi:energy transducer TonB [uncultured Shewanella sp.]|uniref:energy transducer TonB n=1 Tax=uncultured Shewanella sp. TaxID=173975 RepID=UPI00260F6682|nr:energy transducer TonB [uncultured Shewanella sp.]